MKQLAQSKCPNQQNMRCEICVFGIRIKTPYPVERCCAVEESKLWRIEILYCVFWDSFRNA